MLVLQNVFLVGFSFSDCSEEPPAFELVTRRHAKVFFSTTDGKIVSLYRCLLFGKMVSMLARSKVQICKNFVLLQPEPPSQPRLLELAQSLPSPLQVTILTISGGHFAGAVFNDDTVLAHKTFHS